VVSEQWSMPAAGRGDSPSALFPVPCSLSTATYGADDQD
jgi:hypothetical protein